MVIRKKYNYRWDSSKGTTGNSSRVVWCTRSRKFQRYLSLGKRWQGHIHSIVYRRHLDESVVSIRRTVDVKVIKIIFHSQKKSVKLAVKEFVTIICSVFATVVLKKTKNFEHLFWKFWTLTNMKFLLWDCFWSLFYHLFGKFFTK